LTLASQEHTVLQGVVLLFAYALGLGIPFLLVGLLLTPSLKLVGQLRPRLGAIETASGLMLVGLGALIFTDQYTLLTSWMTRVLGTGLAV
jgi:cytochrome c-type biogenesis protein